MMMITMGTITAEGCNEHNTHEESDIEDDAENGHIDDEYIDSVVDADCEVIKLPCNTSFDVPIGNNAKYCVVPEFDSNPFSLPFENAEQEFSHPFIEVYMEDGGPLRLIFFLCQWLQPLFRR